MFGSGFDIGMAVILLILSIIFLIGYGGSLLDLFSGGVKPKERTEQQQAAYERAIGILLLFLAILQALLYFISWKMIGAVCLILGILGFVLFFIYLKNYVDV